MLAARSPTPPGIFAQRFLTVGTPLPAIIAGQKVVPCVSLCSMQYVAIVIIVTPRGPTATLLLLLRSCLTVCKIIGVPSRQTDLR